MFVSINFSLFWFPHYTFQTVNVLSSSITFKCIGIILQHSNIIIKFLIELQNKKFAVIWSNWNCTPLIVLSLVQILYYWAWIPHLCLFKKTEIWFEPETYKVYYIITRLYIEYLSSIMWRCRYIVDFCTHVFNSAKLCNGIRRVKTV